MSVVERYPAWQGESRTLDGDPPGNVARYRVIAGSNEVELADRADWLQAQGDAQGDLS